MGRLSLEFTLAVLLLTLAAPSAGQQATSEIRGRAADRNSSALAGVTVVLTNEDTGILRETTTGPDGSYLASQLVPGRYRIVASLPGFQTLVATRPSCQNSARSDTSSGRACDGHRNRRV